MRPGAEQFLAEMALHYEIVVFTAALQEYADWVLDQIDPGKNVKYRLFRQHALPYGATSVKDLSRLGRDLRKIIIVDNIADNFQLQPENGILIRTWTDDPTDTALRELAPLLQGRVSIGWLEIVLKNVEDVRDALSQFSSQMSEQNDLGLRQYQLSLEKI